MRIEQEKLDAKEKAKQTLMNIEKADTQRRQAALEANNQRKQATLEKRKPYDDWLKSFDTDS